MAISDKELAAIKARWEKATDPNRHPEDWLNQQLLMASDVAVLFAEVKRLRTKNDPCKKIDREYLEKMSGDEKEKMIKGLSLKIIGYLTAIWRLKEQVKDQEALLDHFKEKLFKPGGIVERIERLEKKKRKAEK